MTLIKGAEQNNDPAYSRRKTIFSSIDKNKADLASIIHDNMNVKENASPRRRRTGMEKNYESSDSFSSAESFKDDALPIISNKNKVKTLSRNNPQLADQQSSSESLERMFKVLESS